jgi:predicted DNA-binding transcriptional regulator AlpA
LARRYGGDAGAPVLISLNDACRLTSLSRTAINRWRAMGKFPKAVPLGNKRVAFVRGEVEQWIRERIAERGRAA